MWPILAIGVLLAFAADAAVTKPGSTASSCGAEPKGLQGFDSETTSCWRGAALPSATLGYTPFKQEQASVTAAGWRELRYLVKSTANPITIRVFGSLTASYPLEVSSRTGITISGPAKIICNGAARHPAIIVNRSSRVILQDLTFSGCSDSAVIVNDTATGRPKPITTSGSGIRPPDVLLRNVTIQDCTSNRGGGVAVINSRVVVQDSVLQGNTADGCGGGVYAQDSSLLVMGTSFIDNLGNNTSVDGSCRGGALHAQNSWLAVTHSSFTGNRGVNGSAVLLLLPVGVSQLQDNSFMHNQPRPGLTKAFSSSTGAVSVVGGGVDYVQLSRGPPGTGAACVAATDGLVVVRCSFKNNTASLTGGEGGALSGYEAFLAVINTTIIGTPPHMPADRQPAISETPDSVAYSTGRGRYRDMVLSAYMGGCLSVEASSLLVSGSVLSHCGARFVGGGISLLTVTAVVEDTVLSHNYGDMGGAIRATNGYLSMSNVSVLHNRGLSSAAGVYLESNELLSVHMERLNVHYNALTGRGGGMLGEMVDDNAKFFLSLHDSNFTHNTGTYGGAMCMYSITAADLQNNHIAHNTALKFGGGMECAKFFGRGNQHLSSVSNVWLNNTALIRGGGVITHPCNMTSHGDKFLSNRAAQEGGGFMVYGGQDVRLQNAQVSCNTAQNGAGLMVKLSDSGDFSHLFVRCSAVTANGGLASPLVQANCVSTMMVQGQQHSSSKTQSLLAEMAAATGGTAASSGRQASAVAAEKGGGVYVATEQLLDVFNSTISGNIASSSGAGVYLDRRSVMKATGSGGIMSHNNCTGGSGGGVFMDEGTRLTAADITWSNNQGMFGGALFALGNTTSAKLAKVTMSNNTAAAGGAVASLGGSSITCSSGCSFRYNNAKVGGALMLHGGAISINGSTLLGNSAAATSGMAAAVAGSGAGSETIQYMLGEVQVSAGGAVYVWRGRLQMNRCDIVGNSAWGPTGRGGGIFVDDSQLLLVNSVLSGNWAAAAGGAIVLGPVGSRQLLEVRRGSFHSNGAGLYGGAVAGGLLLPGDAAAGSAGALSVIANSSSSSSRSMLVLNGTRLANNTAGRQGGAVACNLCHSVVLANAVLQQNGAAETGGGLSCLGCTRLTLDNSTFSGNTAASGGGACILAAGEGSSSKDTDYVGNAAGTTAAATSERRLKEAASAAAATAGAGVEVGSTMPTASASRLPTAQQALPGCGVVGSGGGLCLGLWDTEFYLQGSGRYMDNTALFGAGLFIDACSQGPKVCPVRLNPTAITFERNVLSDDVNINAGVEGTARHLLQAAAAPGVESSLGSGADLYVTNATVLVTLKNAAQQMDRPTATTAQSAQGMMAQTGTPKDVEDSVNLKGDSTKQSTAVAAAKGRHLLAQQHQQQAAQQTAAFGSNPGSLKPLAVAQQLAAAVQQSQVAVDKSADDIISRVATGPARLGPIEAVGGVPGASSSGAASLMGEVKGAAADQGRLQDLSLPVLDQLGGQVADDVAEQLSVQATADFGNCTACQLSGISKVLPVNGTARFDQLQLLAMPGSNQTITFKLLSALEGTELPGGGQAVTVRLPSCQWGQATTAVGCYNCTSPLFSFSPSTSKCSICPDNAAYCSFTTLLPDSGYWNSGPLSTRMHKCPRRKACLREAAALMTLQCLQQQQLVLNNPDFADDVLADITKSSNTTARTRGPLSSWNSLRQQCVPILQSWAARATAGATNSRRGLLQTAKTSAASKSVMLGPHLNSTAAVEYAYSALLCAQGYTGRLCTKCIFPGTKSEGPYGHFQAGCGRCPSWVTSLVTFILSRVFDILLVGLLILTTLVEMKKRRAAVQQARKTALSKLATSLSPAAAAAAVAAIPAVPATCQSQSVLTATASSGSSTPTASTSDPQSSATDVMWASGAAAAGDQLDDTALAPAHDQQHNLQQQQQQGSLHNPLQPSIQLHSVDQQPEPAGPEVSAACQMVPQGTSGHLQALNSVYDPEDHQSLTAQQQQPFQQQQQQAGTVGLAAMGSSGPFASPISAFAVPGAVPSAAVSVGVSGPIPPAPAPAASAATAVAERRRQRRPLKRGPLFAREVTSRTGCRVINYSPAQLTTVELFEVFKDFLQVLSILQAVLLGWQTAAAAALSAVSVTPLSTKAWISLDCILPRTEYVAAMLPFYQIAASLLLPLSYTALLLLLWFTYAVSFSMRSRQSFWRMTLNKRLKAPIVSSLLVLLSFFYPSLAYTILSVFSCRYLDPTGGSSSVPGEVLGARGWYWTADLNRQCFVDPGHRAIALGLGIPGALLLLAYPLLQGILLARQAAAGQLTPTSEFFADYGHLVEDFRPRLFYWGSIVELRKLVLVAVVLGLASTGVLSQLVGCSLVLLGFCAATMGLLPYPYRLLNRLHLGSDGVLLAVIWLNLFIAVGEEGGLLSGGISPKHSLALQLLSVALVVLMILLLLSMCTVRLYRKVRGYLDVDGDGRISWSDIQALLARLWSKRGQGLVSRVLPCTKKAKGQTAP